MTRQPAVLAHTLGDSHRPQPRAHGHHHAELPFASSRSRTHDRLKIADRTIIVLTSENGGNMYSEIDGTTPTSNRPLRGGKATVFEGGTRVLGVTQSGSRSDAIIQGEDYHPTLTMANW